MRTRLKKILSVFVAILFAWALWNGFTRGGQDFRVFHYAGKLVLEGRWDALYLEGPDRYLYAPGFALLFAPFSALPETPALGLWLAATVLAFAAAMRGLAKRTGAVPVLLAILFSVRAIAIDLRYGQVNLLILSAGVWAFLSWFDYDDGRTSRRSVALSWFCFSIVAFTKVYPLALFLFPVVALSRLGSRQSRAAGIALVAAALGAAVVLVPPLFVSGVYPAWLDALARKGLPTDTHNQSLLATLVRVFGGEPFYALGLGGQAIRFPDYGATLSIAMTRFIWLSFSLLVMGGLGALAWRRDESSVRRPLVLGLGFALCFLPAHLIWKSYFVLGIPLLAALFGEAERDSEYRKRISYPALLLGLGLACTSGDFVGPRAAAWIEAISPFLWVHLLAITTGFSRLFSRPRSAY
jgi:hypothetical protein